MLLEHYLPVTELYLLMDGVLSWFVGVSVIQLQP